MTLSPSKLLSSGLLSLAFLFSSSAFAGPTPVAKIDSPEQAIVGLVNFMNKSVASDAAGNLSYEWDFGDGNLITTMDATKDYTNSTPGEYTVTLTVSEAGATPALTNSVTKYITILDVNSIFVAPKATFTMSAPKTAGSMQYLVGEPITFTSTSTDIRNGTINNIWDFGEVGNVAAARGNAQAPIQSTLVAGDGAGNLETIVIRNFRAPGTFTITLASQTNFTADATIQTANALTGTYQKTITVIPDPNAPTPGLNEPIEQLYDENCAGCHGKVDTIKDANGVIISYQNTIINGEHSMLAARGPGAPTPPVQVTAMLIEGSYQNTLMQGVRVLNLAEREAMAIYLAGLSVRVSANGAELYRAQCSRCHGTGTGGYAMNVLDTTAAKIERGILTVLEMKTLPTTTDEMKLIVAFLSTTPTPGGAPLLKPTTGNGLYLMYCSYCHGNDGIGGPFVDDSIANNGTSATIILKEIEKGYQQLLNSNFTKNKNKMGKFKLLLNDKFLLISDIEMIAIALSKLNGNTPAAGENDD